MLSIPAFRHVDSESDLEGDEGCSSQGGSPQCLVAIAVDLVDLEPSSPETRPVPPRTVGGTSDAAQRQAVRSAAAKGSLVGPPASRTAHDLPAQHQDPRPEVHAHDDVQPRASVQVLPPQALTEARPRFIESHSDGAVGQGSEVASREAAELGVAGEAAFSTDPANGRTRPDDRDASSSVPSPESPCVTVSSPPPQTSAVSTASQALSLAETASAIARRLPLADSRNSPNLLLVQPPSPLPSVGPVAASSSSQLMPEVAVVGHHDDGDEGSEGHLLVEPGFLTLPMSPMIRSLPTSPRIGNPGAQVMMSLASPLGYRRAAAAGMVTPQASPQPGPEQVPGHHHPHEQLAMPAARVPLRVDSLMDPSSPREGRAEKRARDIAFRYDSDSMSDWEDGGSGAPGRHLMVQDSGRLRTEGGTALRVGAAASDAGAPSAGAGASLAAGAGAAAAAAAGQVLGLPSTSLLRRHSSFTWIATVESWVMGHDRYCRYYVPFERQRDNGPLPGICCHHLTSESRFALRLYEGENRCCGVSDCIVLANVDTGAEVGVLPCPLTAFLGPLVARGGVHLRGRIGTLVHPTGAVPPFELCIEADLDQLAALKHNPQLRDHVHHLATILEGWQGEFIATQYPNNAPEIRSSLSS